MNIEDLYINKPDEYKRFALALVFNDAYVPGAFVFLKTFFKHNPWYNGDVVCFYDNEYCKISDKNKKLFETTFPNLYFKFVNYHIYNKFVEHFYEKMTQKRFIVSAYTLESFALQYDRNGNEYDRVVFLDIDQIVEGDLSLLFLNNKDIVAAPGDNYLINDIDEDSLFYRDDINVNISGGLFSISKKYLGENIRNAIIKFGETFEFDKPEYGACAGNRFEMHVLDIWFRDKDIWLTSSIYAYPSIIFYYNYTDEVFRNIAYKLFENSKIIHIWGTKPWIKEKEEKTIIIDLYWEQLYKAEINNTEPISLKEFFKNDINYNDNIYKENEKYKILTNFL